MSDSIRGADKSASFRQSTGAAVADAGTDIRPERLDTVMRRRRLLRATAGTVAVGAASGCLTDDDESDWPAGSYADYETTRVTVESPTGDALGSVTAAIAETPDQRYLGLSDAESLPEDGGMLFVYDAPRESLTFVMREMAFGIDIVYADAEGTVTRIHNAPAPGPEEDGDQQRYPGSGQYVLEVPYEWTERHGVDVGDVLSFER